MQLVLWIPDVSAPVGAALWDDGEEDFSFLFVAVYQPSLFSEDITRIT